MATKFDNNNTVLVCKDNYDNIFYNILINKIACMVNQACLKALFNLPKYILEFQVQKHLEHAAKEINKLAEKPNVWISIIWNTTTYMITKINIEKGKFNLSKIPKGYRRRHLCILFSQSHMIDDKKQLYLSMNRHLNKTSMHSVYSGIVLL